MTIDLSLYTEMIKDMYEAFIPTSKEKKEEFMDRVMGAVNYYKPLIEEKCKVSLGEVKVKDNKEFLSDFVRNHFPIKALGDAWKNGRIPTESDYTRSFIEAEAAAHLLVGIQSNMLVEFKHYNSTVYVPFNYLNRLMDINFEERAKRVDYGIVHELSHVLWNKLDGRGLFGEKINNLKEFKEARKWHEGFATYCGENYFSEFYPRDIEGYFDNLPKLYKEGRMEVAKAVDKYGEGIILKIPKMWKELAKEN